MNDLINNNWFVSIVTGLIVTGIPKVFNFIKHHLGKKGKSVDALGNQILRPYYM